MFCFTGSSTNTMFYCSFFLLKFLHDVFVYVIINVPHGSKIRTFSSVNFFSDNTPGCSYSYVFEKLGTFSRSLASIQFLSTPLPVKQGDVLRII